MPSFTAAEESQSPLTVAIPTFGNSKFLAQTLLSIKTQTCKTLCSVVDGVSTFPFQDPEWSWVNHTSIQPDPGMIGCWSNAAANLTTEFVLLLADDNTLLETFTAEMVNLLNQYPTCGVGFCNQIWIDENGNPVVAETDLHRTQFGRNALLGGILDRSEIQHAVEFNSISMETCVIRKDIWERYGGFRAETAGSLDLDLILRLINANVGFAFLPKPLMNFRVHKDSYTSRGNLGYLKGTLWTLDNNIMRDKALNEIVRERYFFLFARQLRFQISFAEKARIVLRLAANPKRIPMILKNLFALLLRR